MSGDRGPSSSPGSDRAPRQDEAGAPRRPATGQAAAPVGPRIGAAAAALAAEERSAWWTARRLAAGATAVSDTPAGTGSRAATGPGQAPPPYPGQAPPGQNLAVIREDAGSKVAILVGAGALRATDEVIQVAERLGAGAAMPPLLRPDSVLDGGKPNAWFVIIREPRKVGSKKGMQRRMRTRKDGSSRRRAVIARTRAEHARATLGDLIRASRVVPGRVARKKTAYCDIRIRQHSAVEDVAPVCDRLYCVHCRHGLAV